MLLKWRICFTQEYLSCYLLQTWFSIMYSRLNTLYYLPAATSREWHQCTVKLTRIPAPKRGGPKFHQEICRLRSEVKRLRAENDKRCQERTVLHSLLQRMERKSADSSSLMKTRFSVIGVKCKREDADDHDDDVIAVKKGCNGSVSTPAKTLMQENHTTPSITNSSSAVTLFSI